MLTFTTKSEFFSVLSDLFPTHYFEKAALVRIVWELWISIRFISNNHHSNQSQQARLSVSSASYLTISNHNEMVLVDPTCIQDISVEFS